MSKTYEEKLQEKRARINKIDDELAELFLSRMLTSIEIGTLKKEYGREVLDEIRETELKKRLAESFAKKISDASADASLSKYYENFINEILSSSKDIQKRL